MSYYADLMLGGSSSRIAAILPNSGKSPVIRRSGYVVWTPNWPDLRR